MAPGKEDHYLDLLSLFHTIFGGLTAFGSCLFLIHIFIGLAVVTGHFTEDSTPTPCRPCSGGCSS